ncbi:MAG: tRNA pseudouridine(55) synthase TruB [Gammaproteobacteria bacterium]|nr:tRNA pseudouridine(55) synthase TruB [Gammaproteobacteria bacterium]MBI5617332.1 tRNA pseudouridine(55) synthase TruB [Gammaproteobacteria bacterium]
MNVQMRRARGRDVSGIVLLDKPDGMSSNQALQRVKRAYQAAKAGHTGNLDGAATGLLPVCLGEATKVSGLLLDADKRYVSVFKLGVTTRSGDRDGEIVDTASVPPLSAGLIEGVLARFVGEISQVPPMYSALKKDGQPLYRLAARGLEVERAPRRVTIYGIDLLRLGSDELEVDVRCSKGTYIRTLAEDVGAALGCGGHVASLRRTEAGPFRLAEAHTLASFDDRPLEELDARLMPVDAALGAYPLVELGSEAAFHFGRGQAVVAPHRLEASPVRVYDQRGVLLGMGLVQDGGRIAPKRLFHLS